ncbi:MAG: hypothetical protein V2J55_18155 [Candidatus Competibacteraceae bacterium]|jgi:hypothetical protein|nr:hypothetical protein [Candidatus Competibacteraceae bacterium]
MAESHVITALVAKRAELAGLLDHHRKEIERIQQEVGALDTAIKLFDPEYNVGGIRKKRYRRKNNYFQQNEGARLVLDVLREEKAPMSTALVVDKVSKKKGFAFDSESIKPFHAAVLNTIGRQVAKGTVEKVGTVDNMAVWGLVK